MLSVQNNLPSCQPVKFKGYQENNNYGRSYDDEPDTFSKDDIEEEKNQKLSGINDTRSSLDEMADTLDSNPDKISHKMSKAVRFASAVIGLAGTFVVAKYSSKLTINGMKNIAKSKFVQDAIKTLKGGAEKAPEVLDKAKPFVNKVVENPKLVKNIEALKNSKVGKAFKQFADTKFVKTAVAKAQAYGEAGKVFAKSITGNKVQSAVENTLAASTTASVLIDDLAGRNDRKSSMDLALGNSGGDNE